MSSRLENLEDARIFTDAIMNTIVEPFVVLDDQLNVLLAGRSFYRTFLIEPEQTVGRHLYALSDGQWDIPALRGFLDTILADDSTMEDFEVTQHFSRVGPKIMLLNARRVLFTGDSKPSILLAFADITARRAIEVEKEHLLAQTEELLRQKNVLLQELQHRVANSLQIIASILMLKARAVGSEETRSHLEDARRRVVTVAQVQQHLNASATVDQVEMGSYLTKLCESLAGSMIGDDQTITVTVHTVPSMVASSVAVNIGLIITELLINAIKYAFPVSGPQSCVAVTYRFDGADWQLTISDNGVGKAATAVPNPAGGLGTTIVKALVAQLGASLTTETSAAGTVVTISCASVKPVEVLLTEIIAELIEA
jgi:two-component sensor histidine kinase